MWKVSNLFYASLLHLMIHRGYQAIFVICVQFVGVLSRIQSYRRAQAKLRSYSPSSVGTRGAYYGHTRTLMP